MAVKCCSCWFLIMELCFFLLGMKIRCESVLCLGSFLKMDSKIYLPKESNYKILVSSILNISKCLSTVSFKISSEAIFLDLKV